MDWHCIQHKSFWWFLATFWVRTLVSFSYHMWPMNFETKQHEIHYIRTVPTFQSFWGSHLGDSSNEISARRFLLRQVLLWGFLLCHFCKNLVSLIFWKSRLLFARFSCTSWKFGTFHKCEFKTKHRYFRWTMFIRIRILLLARASIALTAER